MNKYFLSLISKQYKNLSLKIIPKLHMDKQASLSHYGKVPLQVIITSSEILDDMHPTRNLNKNESEFHCIRCGSSMEKSKSIFVNIQPPLFQIKKSCSSMSMEILSRSSDSNTSLETITETSCVEYCIPKSFHICNTSGTETCCLDLECSCQHKSNALSSEILNSDASEEDLTPTDVRVVGSQQSITPNGQFSKPSILDLDSKEGLVSHPCTDCHVAVLSEMADQGLSDQKCISLMLQVPHFSPPKESVECQTDGSVLRSDIGVAVNILEIYPNINAKCGTSEEEFLPGSKQDPQRNLPELDAEAEAAYRCHLKNLVPCSHCGRTFNPDRVMVHENACIERPRKRKRRVRK